MPSTMEQLAVAIGEVNILHLNLPALLGVDHPQEQALGYALSDVETALLTATRLCSDDEPSAVGLVDQQARALGAFRTYVAGLSVPARCPGELDDRAALAQGLLEVICGR